MKKYLFLLFVICFLPGAIDPVIKVPSGLMVEFIHVPEKVISLVPGYNKIVIK